MERSEVIYTSVLKTMRMMLVLAFMITSAVVVINHSASPVKAAGAAIVNVAFDEASATADVSPGKDGIVHLSGYVTCTVPVSTNIQSVQVSLVPSCAWPAAISPSSVTFASADMGKSKAFDVAVIAPPQESMKSSQVITIGGEWRTYPGMTGGSIQSVAQSTIKVLQFFKFSVACSKPFQEVSPGTAMTYSIKINNEGNGRDTFKLAVEKIPVGWSVQLGQTSVDVEEKKSATVTLTVTPPQEWHAWKNKVTTIKLIVTSSVAQTASKINLQEPYYIFLRERGFSTPGFEPMVTASAMLLSVFLIALFRRRDEEML